MPPRPALGAPARGGKANVKQQAVVVQPARNDSGRPHVEDKETCPLCVEDMDDTDLSFQPCPCGYRVCLFCYEQIKLLCNSTCPGCRRIYGTEEVDKPPDSGSGGGAAPSGPNLRIHGNTPTTATTTGRGLDVGVTQAYGHAPSMAQAAAKAQLGGAPPKPPIGPAAVAAGRKHEQPGGLGRRPGETAHDPGLPSGATWASGSTLIRQQSVDAPAPPPAAAAPLSGTAAAVDETAWPSLADAATAAPPPPRQAARVELEPGVSGRLRSGVWNGSNNSLETLSPYDGAATAPNDGQSQQSRFQQQAQAQQQLQQQSSMSYQQLGSQGPNHADAGYGQRRGGANANGNGYDAATAAERQHINNLPPYLQQHADASASHSGYNAAAAVAPNGSKLQAGGLSDPLRLAALVKEKERANGKVPQSTAAGRPPPGFAAAAPGGPPAAAHGGLSLAAMTSGNGGGSMLAQPPTVTAPSLSLLNNEDNPIVSGPPASRCRPISPPVPNGVVQASSGLGVPSSRIMFAGFNPAPGGGSSAGPLTLLQPYQQQQGAPVGYQSQLQKQQLPLLSGQQQFAQSALKPQLWSGLPGIDLGPYLPLAHLWQASSANTIAQQQQQQPLQQPHQQPLMQLQQSQQLQPQLPMYLQQQPQQQQQHALGGLQSAPHSDQPAGFAPSSKPPPPGFGGPVNGFRPQAYQPLGMGARYNPLGTAQQLGSSNLLMGDGFVSLQQQLQQQQQSQQQQQQQQQHGGISAYRPLLGSGQ